MAVITIEGASGIGKSFLTAQLSASQRLPAILEGEPGALPDWIMKSFNQASKAGQRQAWFAERCAVAGRHARQISDAGLDCLVDVGPVTQRAYLEVFHREQSFNLRRLENRLADFRPDLAILLIGNETLIRSRIAQRGRPEEQNTGFHNRIMAVYYATQHLARQYPHLIISCHDWDFTSAASLASLWSLIQRRLCR